MNLDRLLKQNYITIAAFQLKDLSDSVKAKQPERKDLIFQLETSSQNLVESYLDYKNIEVDLRAANKRNLDLEFVLLTKETELIELRKQNAELIKGL